MNHRERFVRTLTEQPVDRVPFIRLFGGTNAIVPGWEQDRPGIGQCVDKVLGFEGVYRGWQIAPVNMGFSQVPPLEILLDDEHRRVQRHGEGTVEVIQKGRDFSHQTLKWPVENRADWERVRDRHLQPGDATRFPPDWPAYVEQFRRRDYPLQLTHKGVYGFARTLMGDVNLAYAFHDTPELVHEMMGYYTDMCIAIWSKMVEDVEFDLIECWEDMASRQGSLISPGMFRRFMLPNYAKIARFAADHGIRIILVDSDGYIEDLTGLMLEGGVTALYPYEVQAGNDVARVLQRFPTVGVIGGLDKNVMARGKQAIDGEMEKARELIRKGRFIPGPDHMVLSDVPWENYRYFMERLREVVMSTKPET